MALVMLVTLGPGTGPALAEAGCVAESEPNDLEVDLPAGMPQGPWCVEGELPPEDQDLLLWEVTDADAATAWDVTLEGVAGTLTIAQVYPIESAPDQRPVVGRGTPILELSIPPESTEAATRTGILVPVGRYLVGVTRSGLPGGGEPTEVAYRLRVEPAAQGLPAVEREPNDDDATATPVTGAFEVGGDLAGSPYDVFGWTVEEPGRLWDLEVLVPLEVSVTLAISAADGRQVAGVTGDSLTRIYDLALEPGRYSIRLSPSSETPRPYILRATAADDGGDPEPNDETVFALPIVDGEPGRGRLATRGDRDRYRLSVPAGDSDLRDIRMIWRSEMERRLCLLDRADQPTVCRSGVGGAALSALALTPGDHILEVTGTADPADAYVLRVDRAGPAPPGFEAEPNDDVASASTLDPAIGARGRGDPSDVDTYHLAVEGEPQLWRLDLTGQGIDSLAWIRPMGGELGRASLAPDGAAATLSDLYLVPGDHWFSVRVDGLEYTLSATPLGPPDPDGEREPNGGGVLAETYRIGQRKVGRLPTAGDVDVYRFSLAAPGHVGLTLAQPADGAIDLGLRLGDELVSQRAGPEVGATITWDLALQPGDHYLELRPANPSEGRYELTSTRLDPFQMAADQEPNDDIAWARPAPASLSWEGDAMGRGDQDWYELPELSGTEPLRVALSDPEASARLTVGDAQVPFDRDANGAFLAADLPSGAPTHLTIISNGPYHAQVSGGGLTPKADPETPALELAWEMPDLPVAAYWAEQQRIDGSLRLTNSGADPLDVDLETATSHYLWWASLDETGVTVPPGESVVVPASIHVGADAWGDETVLVSARARTPGGGATGTVELVATSDGAPTGTSPSWALPDELLGGLNAAFLGFGAVPGTDVDATWGPALFDGLATDGGGFAVQVSELPLELTVDLAGDAPVPVAGVVLDPLARDSRLSDTPADFELSLSLDGVAWQPVLGGQLEPMPVEQSFVLDPPQDAGYARLSILSRHGGGTGYVALGEWKVVASPGAPLSGEPVNLAGPAVGGHLVAMQPFSGNETTGPAMLDAEPRREAIRLEDDPAVEVVVGFQDDRAALVKRLEWLDPDGSDPATRLERVDVWVATQSPLGPWAQLGTWSLARGSDGRVAPFEPAAPAWARFVRLTGQAPPDAREVELPATLRVIESPADETYRSVLGEWGAGSSNGPFERVVTPDAVDTDATTDAPDDAAAASPLTPGVEIVDRVQIGVDDDWYAIEVPLGMSGLEIVVGGRPTVGVAVSLVDPTGDERPMALVRQPDGSVRYQARVEPGERYLLQVRQPPFSAVFTFDTSGSMGPFLDMVTQGMRTFASEVQPGREVVMVVPFEDPPLLPDWEDDPWVLQDAVNNMVTVNSSSGAEAGLLEATKLLEEREGARAVLLVTDAVTSTYRLSRELWDELALVRPIVFAVHIGASEQPIGPRQFMQDWAASGGGDYTYPTTHGAMDRAFQRMATWLRRPAVYSLSVEAVNLDPGTLSVIAPTDDADPLALAPGVGVEIILDTSASMLDRLAGRRRIEIAKQSLDLLVSDVLPEGVPIALRAFQVRRDTKTARCQTRLVQPLGPLDRAAMRRTIDGLKAASRTATPIAAALAEVTKDLSAVTGTRSVVLVTDGDETCEGDPAAAIAALREGGIDVTVNIIGFALEDEELKARMAAWADLGGGRYFDAAGADELVVALAAALGAPIRIYGPDGEVYGGATVGGGPIEVDPGTYRVEVLIEPPVTFEDVVVGGGESVLLELPATE